MGNIFGFLNQIMIIFIPLLVVALGGMISEKGGVVNIALEGIMIVGAFAGILATNLFKVSNAEFGIFVYLIGTIVAGLVGMLFASLHAIASVKMKANQNVSATALNTIAPALSAFLIFSLVLGQTNSFKLPIKNRDFFFIHIIEQTSSNILAPILGYFSPSIIIGIFIFIIVWLWISKCRGGLRLTACGENPASADSCGISVSYYRFLGVLISGALAGIGGFFLITNSTVLFDNSVAGYGFLALAIVIFGNWKPLNILFSSFLFASLVTLGKAISYFPFLEGLNIDSNILSMFPYIATLVILVLSSKKSHAPAASGIYYEKSQ
jgi:simple sugar transport system permease protein